MVKLSSFRYSSLVPLMSILIYLQIPINCFINSEFHPHIHCLSDQGNFNLEKKNYILLQGEKNLNQHKKSC